MLREAPLVVKGACDRVARHGIARASRGRRGRARGRGATLNDAPIAVSTTATLGESLLTTGFPYNIRETRDTNLPEYAAFSVRARAVRRLGSAVLDLAYVACGRFDGFWELRLGP